MNHVQWEKYHENEDIKAERKTATFDTEELTNLLDGNVQATQKRRKFENFLLQDPKFRLYYDPYFLNHEGLYEKSVELVRDLIEKFENDSLHGPDEHEAKFEELNKSFSYSDVSTNASPFFLHVAFYYTFVSQASPSQLDKWLPLIYNFQVIGAYAQTELGHGTNIRNLETTATYDEETEEFILHSPTRSSIKFWPGSMAKTSNHAIVVAQLYTKGKCYGIHAFIVKLRDLKDHSPVKGVTLGSIGPKMGMNAVDNGYLKLDNVRIPRENMMMKQAQVLPDGSYIKPVNPYAAYATMMILRLGIMFSSAQVVAQSSTIAIRYSAVRRQGQISRGNPEVKILDYQTQQFRLFPPVAMAYAFHFTYQSMTKYFHKVAEEVTQDAIAEMHALSSGMKALSTRLSTTGVEECRLACGGIGYLLASRLPSLYNDITPSCTYEGDNYVLLLQTARFLMKSARTVKYGEGSLRESVQFLAIDNDQLLTDPLQLVAQLFQRASRKMILGTAEQLEELILSGKSLESVLQQYSVDLIECSVMFCKCYTLSTLSLFMEETPISTSLKTTLTELFEYLGVHWICENSGVFMMHNIMSSGEINSTKKRLKILMGKLRPNIVALTDAFDFSDRKLLSIIGCYDGQAAERTYDYITNLSSNKQKIHGHPLVKSHL